MTLIDGDRIVTAQLYDDEYEEFKEQKMSIIDFVNAYSDEGVTIADDVLYKIKTEIEMYEADCRFQGGTDECEECNSNVFRSIYQIIDKYRKEQE